ncbi:glycosyltransferase [Chondrinema litorale]|uniref:glycosyltransferase n=1 Tax=Chondrinema litorale TaxID=2994555 RepID=UPI00254370DE|nr:glycosyltransferase [Chondrinema litorale]UZR94496.1 glycosyltransferase [Chondrinema litorale]
MKIAYQSVFYPYRGGIAQFNASLFRALEKKAEIKAFNFSLQYPQILFPGTSQYVSESDIADNIPSERILNSINPLSYLKTAAAIRAYKPDILISAYWMSFLAPAQGTVARLVKKSAKTISVINNITPHERKLGDYLMNQYFLKQQQAHVVMGNAVKNELKEYIPDAKLMLHPHPIYNHFGGKIPKVDALKSLNLPTGKKTLLFFGLIREYKGLDVLLKAFNKLSDAYQLVIAGESYEDFSKYEELINNSPNRDRIFVFRRYIPDDEVASFFSASDLCVLPYKSATQSGVVAVAFHFDLPVLVTDKGNLKDTIEPYDTGIVIDEPDENMLSLAVNKYFEEAQENQFIENIKHFKKKFTWDHMAEELITFAKNI